MGAGVEALVGVEAAALGVVGAADLGVVGAAGLGDLLLFIVSPGGLFIGGGADAGLLAAPFPTFGDLLTFGDLDRVPGVAITLFTHCIASCLAFAGSFQPSFGDLGLPRSLTSAPPSRISSSSARPLGYLF